MAQGDAHGECGTGAGAAAPESCQWMYDTAKRTIAALGGSPCIEVQHPGPDNEPALLPAIAAIRAFRAEVYYADGRRPSFRAPDGRFADPDDADLRAYHITCRDEDVLVGCMRAVPVELLSSSPVKAHLGPSRTAELISELGVDHTGPLEAARLAVTATRRLQGIAAALMMVTLPGLRRERADPGRDLGTGKRGIWCWQCPIKCAKIARWPAVQAATDVFTRSGGARADGGIAVTDETRRQRCQVR